MFIILLKEFKARWLEYSLGIAVVALAVAAFIVQRSLSLSAENEIHGLAHKLGNNMLVVPRNMNMIDFYSFKYGEAAMPENYPELAQNSKAGGHIRLNRPALYGNTVKEGTDVVIIGSDIQLPDTPNHQVRFSRTLITERFAKKFGVEPGTNYSLGGVELNAAQIIINDAGLADYSVIMPLATAQTITRRQGKINALYLGGCWCKIDVPELGKEIESALPGTKAITVAGMIKAQKGVLSVMREYSSMFHIVTMLIVAVTVLVLVLAQFRRYGRELGLLAAFGVSMGELCAHLFAKAVIIGIIGGLAGFFPGLFLAGLSGKFLGVASAAGFEQLAPVLGMSLFSSIIGALIPVYVVFNIDPVETLREA